MTTMRFNRMLKRGHTFIGDAENLKKPIKKGLARLTSLAASCH